MSTLHYAWRGYNLAVQLRTREPAPGPLLVDPHVLGTICGLFSAVVYTCANAFLRAVDRLRPGVGLGCQSGADGAGHGAGVAGLAIRGHKVVPSMPMLAAIAAGGLVGPAWRKYLVSVGTGANRSCADGAAVARRNDRGGGDIWPRVSVRAGDAQGGRRHGNLAGRDWRLVAGGAMRRARR